MKVLIIDDSDYKVESLTSLVGQVLPLATIKVARAFKSGVSLARQEHPDMILLDMSLPTFEVSSGETGGRTRPFGGREILRELESTGHMTNIIVVTQFDRFGERNQSREDLMSELKAEFHDRIVGGVYYGAVDSTWRESLAALLENFKPNP